MDDIADRAAITYKFIAFSKSGNKLQLAMAQPDDYQALEAVRFITKKKNLIPEIYCASPEGIEQALAPKPQENIDQALRDFGKEIKQSSDVPADEKKLQQTLEGVPVSKVFAVIVRHAIEGLASDVHIEPFSTELRIRYRINGQLHTSLLLSLNVHQAIVSRVKILSNIQVSMSNVPQEGRFTFTAGNQAYSVRVAIMPTIHGENITLHLVDTTKAAPSFTELGLIGSSLNALKEQLKEPKGLIIVAGPDGSGKSTTLNAILSSINKPSTCISTVEETIEYEVPGIIQTQIAPTREVTYERVLQNLLRQDIEAIMVEEIRSAKTAHLLTKGALAGRLMLSTIHAQDSLHSIPQLIDLGISPYVLSSSLRLLMSQRLVPKLCQSCKKPVAIPKSLVKTVQQELKIIPTDYQKIYSIPSPLTFYESAGCPDCHEGKAYGQIAIFDAVQITKDMTHAIASGGNYDMLHSIAIKDGHLSLRQDGLLKALQGLVKYNDVVRVTT
jgi:type IV pilus assembly protein PilB